MRIAVIGAGVSGCLVARLLATEHEVTLYSADAHAGGHAQTVDVQLAGRTHAVDVAFMVFNRRTYPQFSRLLDLLDIETQASDMSFSVRSPRTDFEYQGGTLRGLFAQPGNALSPGFWGMIRDILRFNRLGQAAAREERRDGQTVGEFLAEGRFGRRFVNHYLQPMAAAIWSSRPNDILQFPADFLLGFFANHGLLQIRNRPQWRTIVGGSRSYVDRLLAGMTERVQLEIPIAAVRRREHAVEVEPQHGPSAEYDEVVFATHADQTLALLDSPTPAERDTLGAFPYQTSEAILHTDVAALPRRPHARASWNYRLTSDALGQAATVTYDLSRLQRLSTPSPLLLTLNDAAAIDPAQVLREFEFAHPAYSLESIAAQRRWGEISGRDRFHYCGAYWGYGFHEDGVRSALAVADHFGIGLDACRAACTKAPSPTVAATR